MLASAAAHLLCVLWVSSLGALVLAAPLPMSRSLAAAAAAAATANPTTSWAVIPGSHANPHLVGTYLKGRNASQMTLWLSKQMPMKLRCGGSLREPLSPSCIYAASLLSLTLLPMLNQSELTSSRHALLQPCQDAGVSRHGQFCRRVEGLHGLPTSPAWHPAHR